MLLKHKEINIWFYRILALVGFLGAVSLSYQQFLTGKSCPVLYVLPACYLITFVFLGLLVISFIRFPKLTSTIVVFGVAFSGYATFGNFTHLHSCPLTSTGIPVCYIAFIIFCLMGIIYRFSLSKGWNKQGKKA